MNITIKLVEIKIKDYKYYTDVALLVDREDFLNDLFKLRKKWGLDKGLLKYDQKKLWSSFPWRNTKEQATKHLKTIAPFEKRMENAVLMDTLVQQGRFEKFMNEYEKARRILPSEDFYLDIQQLRKKYRRPFHFDQISGHAVIYGIVRNEDYVPCEMEILEPELEFYQYFKEPELIIKFSPLAKNEDIRDLLIKEVAKKRMEYEKSVLGGILPKDTAKTSIRKHREWYWLNKKQGVSHGKILEMEKNKYADNTIAKGIQRYKEKLSIRLK